MTPSPHAATTEQVVFVTRKFPPTVGGMQTLARQVHEALRRHGPSRLVALGRSQRHLVWFLPVALVRVAALVLTRRSRIVLCGDAITGAVMSPLRLLPGVRVVVMVHGLDLTFPFPGYRAAVSRVLRRVDRVVANSSATAQVAHTSGIPAGCTDVVNPATDLAPPPTGERAARARELRRLLDLDDDTFVVASVGRLVRRKGVRWFVTDVLPKLPDDVHLVVAGTGDDADAIVAAVDSGGLDHRVHLLGNVDDHLRDTVLLGADCFVMPNIAVRDDMEGFGLAAIEAAVAGTAVVASRLEGIEDAMTDGATGYLCDPEAADQFVDRILELRADSDHRLEIAARFQAETAARSSPERYSDELVAVLGLVEGE